MVDEEKDDDEIERARPGCLTVLPLLFFLLLLRFEQWLMSLLPGGRRTFFETDDFPWVREIEAGTADVRAELDALLPSVDLIPNFQDIQREERRLTQDDKWKVFILHGYGVPVEENLARCPKTAELLRKIPGMTTAMFSILRERKDIPPHEGPYKGVLRYHLALRVPGEPGECRIRVGDDTRSWTEGKSLVFDDTHTHQVWKECDGVRAVLFVDFLRPLPAPLAALNRWTVRSIARKPFIRAALENLGRWEKVTGADLDRALARR